VNARWKTNGPTPLKELRRLVNLVVDRPHVLYRRVEYVSPTIWNAKGLSAALAGSVLTLRCCISNRLATRWANIESDRKPQRGQLFRALRFHEHHVMNAADRWIRALLLEALFGHPAILARESLHGGLREALVPGSLPTPEVTPQRV
jgi:hypothetical protein